MGNRLTRSAGVGSDTYAYGTTSNRIASITPASGPVKSFTLDNNGSTTTDGTNTYTYDTRGRMVQAVSTLGTTTYHVNALGQRVRKTNSLGDRVFHYDLQGQLIAESTASGSTLTEYLWLGDMPVALVDGSNRFYIHVDYLNTPRHVANTAGTALWRWDQQEPFGVNAPDENPSGLGMFEQPLRFPGQYADKETSFHYNYLRDCYDPATGRYCQSDPIGLEGGINTYAYVSGTPLSRVDPSGQQGVALVPEIIIGGGIICLLTPGCKKIVDDALKSCFYRTPAPFLPDDPYSPEEASRRQSEWRRQLGAPSLDPDSPIPDQGPGRDMGGHKARGGTPHETGERNVNPNEEHSKRPKDNPSGARR